jgi:ankyrin repeat protein
VQSCVASGIDANLTDGNGRNAAHWAADYGLRSLGALRVTPSNAPYCCYSRVIGQVDVLAFLVSQGLSLAEKDNYGITPLLAATYEGHDRVVQFLLEHGVDRSVAGPDGLTAEQAAEKASTKALFSAPAPKQAPKTPVKFAKAPAKLPPKQVQPAPQPAPQGQPPQPAARKLPPAGLKVASKTAPNAAPKKLPTLPPKS